MDGLSVDLNDHIAADRNDHATVLLCAGRAAQAGIIRGATGHHLGHIGSSLYR